MASLEGVYTVFKCASTIKAMFCEVGASSEVETVGRVFSVVLQAGISFKHSFGYPESVFIGFHSIWRFAIWLVFAGGIMALKIVLLALLVCCAASEAQSQGDDTSLPLSYNITELPEDGATCANDQLREDLRQTITSEVEALLQGTISAELGLPILLPQCSCLAEGQRVAYLDMTDPNQQCPPEWREVTSPRRVCGRPVGLAGCRSAFFPVTDISYSKVCGRIVAYQCEDPDGFNQGLNIESHYVEGVSITHGRNPRQHIWSFVALETESLASNECGCDSGGVSQSIAGRDYFCSSGSTQSPTPACNNGQGIITSNPLWDGDGCGPTSTCCELNNPPWFCKTLPQPTTDDIEVRICSSGSIFDEDTPIELVEIYVG